MFVVLSAIQDWASLDTLWRKVVYKYMNKLKSL